MDHKSKVTWVLVADGGRARIFVRGSKKVKAALGLSVVHEHLKTREALSDKPGRGFESMGGASHSGQRHSIEPKTDWHDHQKEVFAQELADILNKADVNHEFDELILVAPPEILGNLRACLDKRIQAKVTAELAKDVAKMPAHQLPHYLEESLME